jgi:glycosyltransferase involved in cell wall biosynthesis
VRVLCGAPATDDTCAFATESSCVAVPLATWGRLDRQSDWQAFATKAAVRGETLLSGWAPDCVLGVDWTSVAAFEALFQQAGTTPRPPLVYCNWRVFSRSDPDALPLERHAAHVAAATIALSSVDADYIRQELLPQGMVFVVPPPLRLDVYEHAAAQASHTHPRTLLCCCVRLSREKEPHRFIEAVEELVRRNALHHVLPTLVGVPRDPYGQELVARLRAAVPHAEIHTQFLSPQQLGDAVFSRALLNVHPCAYDSFAQSVVEAAAYGCPSLLDPTGVGAADVLRPSDGLAFALTSSSTLADCIHALLQDAPRLLAVGRAAQRIALSMDEGSTATATGRILEQVVSG